MVLAVSVQGREGDYAVARTAGCSALVLESSATLAPGGAFHASGLSPLHIVLHTADF